MRSVRRFLQKWGGFDSLGLSLADASPISRRDLSQASLVDAMVSGSWQGWRISGPDRAVVRLVGVRGFAFADPWLGDGRARLSAFDDVQIVLLQQWHTLSDPGAEEAVRDRLSFRRFCGLPLEVETPDYASIWRFRQAIDKLGLSTKLLAKVNRQLDALGFVIKRGTAHRRDHHRRGGQAPLTCAAASIRATRTRISHWPSPFQPKAARSRPATSVASGGADAGKLGESVEPRQHSKAARHAPRACSPASRIQVRSAKAT